MLTDTLFIWLRSEWFEITGSWMKLNPVNSHIRKLECGKFCKQKTMKQVIFFKFSELPLADCIVSSPPPLPHSKFSRPTRISCPKYQIHLLFYFFVKVNKVGKVSESVVHETRFDDKLVESS
jgi:hypothetical protein